MSDYLRHLVVYRHAMGHTCEVILRIHRDVADQHEDARRQIIGNSLPCREVASVEPYNFTR